MIGAFTLALFAAGPATIPERPSEAQCQLALQAVKSIAAKENDKVVFNFVEDDFIFNGLTPERLSDRWRSSVPQITFGPPSAALRENFVRTGKLNAIARCVTIQHWLTHKKIKFGQRAADQTVSRIDNQGRFPAVIYTIGLPVISGGAAIRYVALSTGEDASGGQAEYLVRDVHGEWTLLATLELFIS